MNDLLWNGRIWGFYVGEYVYMFVSTIIFGDVVVNDADVVCGACGGKRVIRKGRRRVKYGRRQLYYCKDCNKGFCGSKLSNKTYGPKVIGNAISEYNLGSTVVEAVKHTNRRFKVKVSKSSVHGWVKEFSDVCTFRGMRDEIVESYGKDEMIAGRCFEHKGLSYEFQYHLPKLDVLCGQRFGKLREYIRGFDEGCPKYFGDIENRCSQMNIDISARKERKFNNACRLAGFALKLFRSNRERHSAVERFMLVNDSCTVACEVPVWLWEKNINAGINGHVDVLQVRNGLVYVLDFKPRAAYENAGKVASQLYFYASGLSFRTGIALGKFRCAWFDERNYFEFEPALAKVRFS